MQSIKREFVEICKLLYERGLARAWGGNVGVRKGKNHIVITPRGRRGKKAACFSDNHDCGVATGLFRWVIRMYD